MNTATIANYSEETNTRPKLVVRSPFDDSVVGEVDINSAEEIERSISAATAAFADRNNWPEKEQRIQILARTAELMEQHRRELALLATAEGGKPITDSLIEVDRAIDGLRCCCDVLRTQTGQMIPMDLNAASRNRTAFTCLEPIGPVLAFSAFNHPLNLIVHQVAPAIAAGCPVVVKPAESTPLSCKRFVEFLYEAGLPRQWCQLVIVDSIDMAAKLVSDERWAFFTFIGSARVGWHLRSTLAPGVRCTLEHGGTAPVIVDGNTTCLDDIIPAIGKGGFYHAGQVCVSVQKVFAQDEYALELAEKLAEYANRLTVGDPSNHETEVGPLIRSSEVQRVHEWVNEGIETGGNLLCGGEILDNNCYRPTVLFDPSPDARISQNEVFGPVVCVYPVQKIKDAVHAANASPFSFQAAVFSDSNDVIRRVTQEINAATVMVNDHTAFRVDWMPFAGHKSSGLGIGGIGYTIREMQAEKLVVINSRN